MKSRLFRYMSVLVVTLTGGLMLALPGRLLAATDVFNGACSQQGADQSTVCQSRTDQDPITGTRGILLKTTNIILVIIGITAVIIIIIAGIQYVLSAGEGAKTAQAKDTIIYAVVGLVVAILAKTIVAFFINKIT